jgi:endonuclease I
VNLGDTYAIRYWRGHYYVYQMWHDPLPPRHWRWARCYIRYKYKRLDNALKRLEHADAVMLFVPQED